MRRTLARARSGVPGARFPRRGTPHRDRHTCVSVAIPRLEGRGMTISDQLARWARRTPDVIALRFEGTGRSYAEWDARVTRLANALADRGIGAGDRIAVLALNRLEVMEAFVATA